MRSDVVMGKSATSSIFREAPGAASSLLGGPPIFERAGAELLVEGPHASALAWFTLAWLAASACLACCARAVQ